MTQIKVDQDTIRELLKGPAIYAEDLQVAANKAPVFIDAGLATDKIMFVIRAAAEASQIAVDSVQRLSAIASASLGDQMNGEQEIVKLLEDFE